jgi:hypothetical protein
VIVAVKRPLSLSIFAWLLLVGGMMTPISSLITLAMPQQRALTADMYRVSLEFVMAMNLLMGLCSVVAGIGMLKGHPRARELYVGSALAGIAFGAVSTKMISAPLIGLAFLAVALFILYRAPARDFFANRAKGKSMEEATR